MSFDRKAYHRELMRRLRAERYEVIVLMRVERRRKRLIAMGKCPISEILLISRFHDEDCPCLKDRSHE